MRKKVFYRYNSSTLTYERVFPSKKEKVFSIIRQVALAFLFGFIIFWVTSYLFDSPREKELIKELKLKDTQYKLLSKRMDEAIDILSDLQQRDDYMYRAVFHADPIPLSLRKAGSSMARYEQMTKISNSELIIQTSKKMDLIAKQIYLQSNSFDEVVDMAKSQKDRLNHIPSIQPVANKNMKRVASGYGWRTHPIYGTRRHHNGMDFTADSGTAIYVTGDGVVEYANWKQGFGNCVIVDHGYNFKTVYAHMRKYTVKVGQKLVRGQQIGEVGSTGLSTGPHLHYEVHVKGLVDNPAKYYHNDFTPEEYDEFMRIAANRGQVMD